MRINAFWLAPCLSLAVLPVALAAHADETSLTQAPATVTTDAGAGGSAGAWVLRPPKVFGYVQVHYRHTEHTGSDPQYDSDNFRVQRVRLGVRGRVFSWLGYDVEIDPRAPLVSTILRDAYLRVDVIPRHELRIGQQKTQFGYETRESSSDLYVVNRAELSDALARGRNLRDIGIGLIGNVKLGGGFRIEDAITVVNGAGMNVQADDTRRKNVFGRLGLRYKDDGADLIARLGVSGATGDLVDPGDDPDDPADDFRLVFKRLGVDVEVEHRWFFVCAEYARGTEDNVTSGESDEPSGYYVTVVGKLPWRVGPLARFDTMGEDFQRWTFGAFYGLPGELLRVLINYEVRVRKDGARGDDRLYVWTQLKF